MLTLLADLGQGRCRLLFLDSFPRDYTTPPHLQLLPKDHYIALAPPFLMPYSFPYSQQLALRLLVEVEDEDEKQEEYGCSYVDASGGGAAERLLEGCRDDA